MGSFISFLSWLFSDPAADARGRPQMYLSSTPAFTVRKSQSQYTDADEKTPVKDCDEPETEVVSMRSFLETHCQSLLKKYTPTWWLPNGHFQTIWCALGDFEKHDLVTYTRTLISLPDGGTIGLDWTQPEGEELPPTAPVIVVLHGLTGGSYEPYVRSILSVACRSVSKGGLGYRAVVMNFRGCAGVELTSPQMFSGGYTGDIRTTLLYVSSLYPDAPLLGVGFSLGANVLARYVGEEGENCRLTSACVMACPWDNIKNSELLETRWLNHAIYSKAMGGTLSALFNRNSATLSSFKEPSAITPHLPILLSMKNPDFVDVNAHLTSIIGGSFPPFPFATVHEYYAWSSAVDSLATIRVPFLALNSLDDPIVAEVPIHEAGKNPYVALVVTKQGGHLGWFVGGGFAGRGKPVRKWNVQPVCEWFEAIVEHYVDVRPTKNAGKPRFVNDEGFTMEEGSGPFVGYKVKATGLKVEGVVRVAGAVAGL